LAKRVNGQPRCCDNEAGKEACLKQLKNCLKNRFGVCLNCEADEIKKYKR
jgi:hypothetical protein